MQNRCIRLMSTIALAALVTLLMAPDVGAQNAAPVTVKLVDSAGNPVKGAIVLWYRGGKGKQLTVENGTTQVPNAEGLIVAQCDGFQFNGLVLDDLTSSDEKLVLSRDDEATQTLGTNALPFSGETRKKILAWFETTCDGNLQRHADDDRIVAVTLQLLGRINPQKTLEFIEKTSLKPPVEMSARQYLVKGAANKNFDLAAEVADDVQEPMFRASMFMNLLKSLAADDPRTEAVELQLIEAIKSVPQPQLRLAMWASLAERYQISGRNDAAQKIVDEHLEEAKKLPTGGWSGYPRSLFAALIVNDDFEQASQMIKGMDDNERNRAIARLAFHCCREHPERAIELLSRLTFSENSINTASYPVKIAHRMAVEQTVAAFKVAAGIDEPNQRAWAYAMIADRVCETDRDAAKRALQLARESLNDPEVLKQMSHFSPGVTMAGILPVFEKVEPERIQGDMWNAVWLAIPRSRWTIDSRATRIENSAVRIARYDAALAKALNRGEAESGLMANQLVLGAKEVPEQLKQKTRQEFVRSLRPTEKLIELLQSDATTFWNKVSLPDMMQWPTDKFEDY